MSPSLTRMDRVLTPKKVFLIILDLLALPVSFFLAYWIYFNGHIPIPALQSMASTMGILGLISFILDYLLGYWDQMWPYAGIKQYLFLVLGTVIETLILWLYHVIRGRRIPAGVLIFFALFVLVIIVGFRLAYQYSARRTRRREGGLISRLRKSDNEPPKIRCLIVGAGDAGYQLVHEMKNTENRREAIAFIDDNPGKIHYRSLGVPVVGNRNDIQTAVHRYAIDEIIVAIPSASQEDLRQILSKAHATGLPVKILPNMGEILDGTAELKDLKQLDIEDLLGRDPVSLDMDGISEALRDKVILVTGGGGSIGSEIVRRVIRFNPRRVVVFDIYENNAYDLQQELRNHYGDELNLDVLIGSVRDVGRLREVFSAEKPDVVFHAAAHKHVPLMEDSPGEAVKNNIFGTYQTAMVAGEFGVERFVLISTDKAVNPTNVMGASKRIAEMAILAAYASYPGTCYASVRFGNVLGSNGSVVPLFRRQIKEQGYVTVTHPEIKRYFMTIPEAAKLVLQTAAFARGGEIFILDMNEPVKIVDLARDLIRLSGFEPDRDIKIKYIGLRPGEKLVEELALMNETMDKTKHEKIFVLQQVRDRASLEAEMKNLKSLLRYDSPELTELMASILDRIAVDNDPAASPDDRGSNTKPASSTTEAEAATPKANSAPGQDQAAGGKLRATDGSEKPVRQLAPVAGKGL